jgi:hypothetical protein
LKKACANKASKVALALALALAVAVDCSDCIDRASQNRSTKLRCVCSDGSTTGKGVFGLLGQRNTINEEQDAGECFVFIHARVYWFCK